MSKRTFTIFGHTFKPNIISDQEYDEMMRRQQEIERAELVERYRDNCFADKRLKESTFETDDRAHPGLSARAQDYAKRFNESARNGRGLLLYGTVGTGKTFMAACIANAVIEQGFSCKMTTFSRISNELQATWEKQAYINKLMRYDLLIIDDLAAERDTEYMREVVFTIIDERSRSGKPLIITSNLTGYELTHPGDTTKSRIYSRLFEMCDLFKVEGKDRRAAKFAARRDDSPRVNYNSIAG